MLSVPITYLSITSFIPPFQCAVRGVSVEQLVLQSDPFLVGRSQGTSKDDISVLLKQQMADTKRRGWYETALTDIRDMFWRPLPLLLYKYMNLRFLKNLKVQVVTTVDDNTVQTLLRASQVQ